MSTNKPPKNYEDLCSKISTLVLSGHGSLISQSLQSLLIQKISTPLIKDLNDGMLEINGKRNMPSLENLLRNNGFVIDCGILKVSGKNFAKQFMTTFMILGFSIMYLAVMPKLKSTPKFNLIYGLTKEMIYRQTREIQCDEFFKKIDHTFCNSESLNLIQLPRLNFRHRLKKGNFRVVKYIPLFLMRAQKISRLQLIMNLMKRIKLLVLICRQLPSAVLLGPDIMLDSNPLIELKKIKSVSTTVSQWGIQPFFFHKLVRIPRNFFWYSSNSIVLANNKSAISDLELSYLRLIKASRHFVWTESFGKLIKKTADVDYTVLDFILFYLPKNNSLEQLYDMTIFDVTPMNKFSSKYYYSDENCMKFLKDSINICNTNLDSGKNRSIALKPKRKYSRVHSKLYINFVRNLLLNNNLTLVDPNVDLFDLIKSSKFIVVIPFSTPALIAKRLGVKVCYYNPDPHYRFKKIVDGVRVFSTIEDLKQFYIEQ